MVASVVPVLAPRVPFLTLGLVTSLLISDVPVSVMLTSGDLVLPQLDSSLDDLTNAGTLTRSRNKVISVVDARRAQNCTILLSKLKLTDKEIKS